MKRNICGNCGHFIPSLDMCACEDSPECGELIYENSEACEKFLSLEGALSSDESETKKVMSKRAEIAALTAYPKEIKVAYGPLPGADGPCEFDDNLPYRIYYQNGYEQAEKDLALTKDDVWCIFNLVRELQTKYLATEGCLQEVADIFNEQRQK